MQTLEYNRELEDLERDLLDLIPQLMGERLADLVALHTPEARERPPLSFADVPAQTAESLALSKAMKKRGFRFVGPTTMYALLQAVGAVDDHIQGCWLAQISD